MGNASISGGGRMLLPKKDELSPGHLPSIWNRNCPEIERIDSRDFVMRTIPWTAPEADFGFGAAEMFELAFALRSDAKQQCNSKTGSPPYEF